MRRILAATALAFFAQEPRADQAKIDAAVRKGVEYLRSAKTPGVKFAKIDDSFELVLLTLIHAGVSESDPKVQELLKKMLDEPLDRTYKVVLQAMILEELERVRYQPRIVQCAQFLVDNQAANGQWSYGEPTVYAKELPPQKDVATGTPPKAATGVRDFGAPGKKEKPKVVRKIPVKKMKDGPESGDNSNSQYAALGLRACHDAGIVLPREVLLLARKWWLESQHPEPNEDKRVATGDDIVAPARGWCYNKATVCAKNHRAYASMTAGAVGGLAIYDFVLEIDRKKDGAIRSGLAWLNAHWSVTANEGPVEFDASNKTELYYYLYALERMGMLLDVQTVAKHDWYLEGAGAILIAQQADGSWFGGAHRCNPTWDTCFAILFLKKATQRLEVASEDTKGRR